MNGSFARGRGKALPLGVPGLPPHTAAGAVGEAGCPHISFPPSPFQLETLGNSRLKLDSLQDLEAIVKLRKNKKRLKKVVRPKEREPEVMVSLHRLCQKTVCCSTGVALTHGFRGRGLRFPCKRKFVAWT